MCPVCRMLAGLLQQRFFYCGYYCLLNMFRAPVCPSSGAQEYYIGGTTKSERTCGGIGKKKYFYWKRKT